MLVATTGLLLGSAYLWAKLRPETIYAVMQGSASPELKAVSGLSFKETVLYWGFETAGLLALSHMLKGFVFSLVLIHSKLFSSWQMWLGLCCLLAFLRDQDMPVSKGFWKRWTVFLGAVIPLYLPLAQLTAAVFLSSLLLTRQKRLLALSGTLAGLLAACLYPLPWFDKFLMLAACLLVSCGLNLSHPIYTGFRPLTKKASGPI